MTKCSAANSAYHSTYIMNFAHWNKNLHAKNNGSQTYLRIQKVWHSNAEGIKNQTLLGDKMGSSQQVESLRNLERVCIPEGILEMIVAARADV